MIQHHSIRTGSGLALALPCRHFSDPGGYFAATGTVFAESILGWNGSQAIGFGFESSGETYR